MNRKIRFGHLISRNRRKSLVAKINGDKDELERLDNRYYSFKGLVESYNLPPRAMDQLNRLYVDYNKGDYDFVHITIKYLLKINARQYLKSNCKSNIRVIDPIFNTIMRCKKSMIGKKMSFDKLFTISGITDPKIDALRIIIIYFAILSFVHPPLEKINTDTNVLGVLPGSFNDNIFINLLREFLSLEYNDARVNKLVEKDLVDLKYFVFDQLRQDIKRYKSLTLSNKRRQIFHRIDTKYYYLVISLFEKHCGNTIISKVIKDMRYSKHRMAITEPF